MPDKKTKAALTNLALCLGVVGVIFGVTVWLENRSFIAPVEPEAAGPELAAVRDMAAPLPAFAFKTLDGKEYHAKDLAGRFILINFWASWCPPCVAEFPRLLELAARYPDELVVLAISSDQKREAITRFQKRFKGRRGAIFAQENVLMVHDPDGALTYDLFQTARLPETIVVDREQKMVAKLIGASWTIGDVKSHLDQKAKANSLP